MRERYYEQIYSLQIFVAIFRIRFLDTSYELYEREAIYWNNWLLICPVNSMHIAIPEARNVAGAILVSYTLNLPNLTFFCSSE